MNRGRGFPRRPSLFPMIARLRLDGVLAVVAVLAACTVAAALRGADAPATNAVPAPAAPPAATEPPAEKKPEPIRAAQLPVRALMLYGLPPAALEEFLTFVRQDLPREGVNHLVFQIDYHYEYKSRPELVSAPAYSEAQIKSLVRACREAGVTLVPLLNCLGHQSWAKTTHKLLTVYPQFDETPGLYPENKDIYCRSYCPNHPDVHKVMFDLLGEVAEVFETKALHVGMDEVFLLGEDGCKRCQGLDKAELFAQEVRTLRDFLATKGVTLWIWGDRFLDGRTTGLGKWEGSFNHTHRAIDLVPKDIVICDWHYEAAVPTPSYFALKGFNVISCSWNKPAVGAGHVDEMVRVRAANAKNRQLAQRMLGVMATNWGKSATFVSTYRKAKEAGAKAEADPVENFIRLFEYVRKVQSLPESAATAPTSP